MELNNTKPPEMIKTKEVTLTKLVFADEKYCTGNGAWSEYDKCEQFEPDSEFCRLFGVSLEIDHIEGAPEIDGPYAVKCEKCKKSSLHGRYEGLVNLAKEYIWLFESEGGATIAAFKKALEQLGVDPDLDS
ncbi:hypothetical protein KKI24_02855 [bacterium]|nr:hypothetical protein [bacterium]